MDVDDFAADTTCSPVRNSQGPKNLPRWPQLAEMDFIETERPLIQHQLGFAECENSRSQGGPLGAALVRLPLPVAGEPY